MSEILMKYVNREINDALQLAKLRDDADFMLEVFRFKMVAQEFDNVSERLKDDVDFIQRTKDVFSANSAEFFNLIISLRKRRKEKEQQANQQVEHQIDQQVSNQVKEEKSSLIHKDNDNKMKLIKTTSSKETTIKTQPKKSVLVKKEKCKNLEKDVDEDIKSFAFLIGQLPISEDKRELLIAKYSDSSEEKRMVALMMVYDFVNYYGKAQPVKLLKTQKNYFYNCF